MDLVRYIFGSSVIVIFFSLVLFIYSLVYLKGLIQKRERGFESNLVICQLLLNVAALICVLKIIELFTWGIYQSEGISLHEAMSKYFNESNTFLFSCLGIITLFIVISKLRFKESFPRSWYKYLNFIIGPAIVITLHTYILALITKPAPSINAHVIDNEEMDIGVLDDGIFKNKYFNFTMKVPTDWHIFNKDQIKKLGKASADITLKNKEDAKKLLAAIDKGCIHLSIAKYDPQLMPVNNYSLVCMSMNLGKSHGFKNPKEFMEYAKTDIQKTLKNVKFYGDIQENKFNGKNLFSVKYSTDIPGETVFQEYFATLKNQHALAFVISYTDDAGKAKLF